MLIMSIGFEILYISSEKMEISLDILAAFRLQMHFLVVLVLKFILLQL